MTQVSHILVLSQPEFVQRQVGTLLAEPHPGTAATRRRIGDWLGFRKRAAPLV
jgi:hypothetical protein